MDQIIPGFYMEECDGVACAFSRHLIVCVDGEEFHLENLMEVYDLLCKMRKQGSMSTFIAEVQECLVAWFKAQEARELERKLSIEAMATAISRSLRKSPVMKEWQFLLFHTARRSDKVE